MSDTELLADFRGTGDNRLLGILLQRYTLLLFGVCMKYLKNEEESRDAVQQIFLKVIQELGKYKVDYFKSWLYMVAKNHCLMKIRERNGRIPAELNESTLATPQEETDRQRLIQYDRNLDLMQESLFQLNPEQKQCVTLFYLQKKSYQEVSEVTGHSLMQVKSHIQNGKRNLRNLIEKKQAESRKHHG